MKIVHPLVIDQSRLPFYESLTFKVRDPYNRSLQRAYDLLHNWCKSKKSDSYIIWQYENNSDSLTVYFSDKKMLSLFLLEVRDLGL